MSSYYWCFCYKRDDGLPVLLITASFFPSNTATSKHLMHQLQQHYLLSDGRLSCCLSRTTCRVIVVWWKAMKAFQPGRAICSNINNNRTACSRWKQNYYCMFCPEWRLHAFTKFWPFLSAHHIWIPQPCFLETFHIYGLNSTNNNLLQQKLTCAWIIRSLPRCSFRFQQRFSCYFANVPNDMRRIGVKSCQKSHWQTKVIVPSNCKHFRTRTWWC